MMLMFPADCPHPVPCGIGDAWDVPAYSDVLHLVLYNADISTYRNSER